MLVTFEIICKYFLYFIIYSFIGWIIEVIYEGIQNKKIINRGFLMSPICPIYGYGVLFIIYVVNNDKADILAVFLKTILICSALEYFTSYFMEKIFEARWWDYSNKKFNINGRICLETMLPFGILGSLVIYVIHPFIEKIINLLGSKLTIILSIILFVIYIIDNIISFNVLNKIKLEIKNHRVDNTELIRSKVFEWLDNHSSLYRRIRKAFPKFRIIKR